MNEKEIRLCIGWTTSSTSRGYENSNSQKPENSSPVQSSSKPNRRHFDAFNAKPRICLEQTTMKIKKQETNSKTRVGYNINEKGRIYYQVAKVANWKGRHPIKHWEKKERSNASRDQKETKPTQPDPAPNRNTKGIVVREKSEEKPRSILCKTCSFVPGRYLDNRQVQLSYCLSS